MRADIHDGQEHKRSVQGPDTEAQDLSPPNHHFPLATRVQRAAGPYRSAKSRLMHLQQKHGRSRWNIFKQRAEPRCENSILHKKSVEKKTVSIAGFFNLSFFMGHNCLWRSHAYSGSASTQSGTLFWQGEAFS